MLKEDENKYCADCQAKTPRWAAWNLGVFICIRCAGIHRNLGVHISKVRSVNLDSWTAEQVQSMRVMGNEKARKVYEHSLPDHFRRSMADHQMEQFIRAKYEQKRYMLSGFVYPRVDVNDLPKPGQPASKLKAGSHSVGLKSPNAVRVSAAAVESSNSSSAVVNDLLDFSSPASSTTNVNGNSHMAGDFASLSLSSPKNTPTSQESEFDDVFGSFASAPVIDTIVPAGGSQPASPAHQPTSQLTPPSQPSNDLASLSSAGMVSDTKKTNADILSLFGDQTKCPTQPVFPVGGFAAFGLQAAPPHTSQSMPGMAAFGAATPISSENATFTPAPSMLNSGFTGSVPQMQPRAVPQAFPNPFEQSSGLLMMQGLQLGAPTTTGTSQTVTSQASTPTSPTAACSARANNAFADLSIGKVLNMNYLSAKPSVRPAVTTQPQSGTPSPANMNFDDLLGL